MTTMQGYEIEFTVPPERVMDIPHALERYDTKSGWKAIEDWFESMNPGNEGDFTFAVDDRGVHLSGECGVSEQYYSETTRLRNMLGLAQAGGWATVRYEDDGGGEYTLVATDGGIVEHKPILVYPTLPHTITNHDAEVLSAALAARPNRSHS